MDVRALPPESYGAALQYFTGSKEHNVVLRSRALEDGPDAERIRPVPRGYDEQRVAGETEEEIYRSSGPRLDSAGAARESGRDRSAAEAPGCRSWSS